MDDKTQKNPHPNEGVRGLRRLLRLRVDDVPSVWLDVETTGLEPGLHGVVQVALVRFELGSAVASETWTVNPGRPIPKEATEIHGIRDEDVAEAPTIDQVLGSARARELAAGALPGAYNAGFDHDHLVGALHLLGLDARWPWLDSLTLVRVVDRFERGVGRHKLENAAPRHGVILLDSHDAGSDATAAGCLFYKLARQVWDDETRLVWRVLLDTHTETGRQWADFQQWLAAKERTP
jgi:DNA polymerase III epsilon subunit-like protein